MLEDSEDDFDNESENDKEKIKYEHKIHRIERINEFLS